MHKQELSTDRQLKLFSVALYPDWGVSTLLTGNLVTLPADGWHQTTTVTPSYDMRLQCDSQMSKTNSAITIPLLKYFSKV